MASPTTLRAQACIVLQCRTGVLQSFCLMLGRSACLARRCMLGAAIVCAMSCVPTATPAELAVQHVYETALSRRTQARQTLTDIFQMSDLAADALPKLTSSLQTHARVAIHFHPDRLVRGGETVAASLLATGCIQSQFESQISNGR